MKDWPVILKSVLQEVTKLSLKGIGTLYLKPTQAEMDEDKLFITAPGIKIFFDPDISEWDEYIIEYIVNKELSSKEDAQFELERLIKSIQTAMEDGDDFHIKGLGHFTNRFGKTAFKADENLDLAEDSFGLTPISYKIKENKKEKSIFVTDQNKTTNTVPIPKIEPIQEQIKVKKRSRILPWLIAGLLIPVIIAAVIFALFYFENLEEPEKNIAKKEITNTKQDKASSPKETKKEDIIAIEKEIEKSVEKKNSLNPIPLEKKAAQKVEIAQPDSIFYIVIGSYKERKNAQKQLITLKESGLSPEILDQNDLLRVYISKFHQKNKAKLELEIIKEQGFSAWILSKRIKE